MGNESINWDKLGFDYIKTDKRYLSHWRNGEWDKGTLTEDRKTATLASISTATDMATGVKNAELVVEAATENIDLKLKIFKDIDANAPAGCILATNTSSISITRIAAVTGRPEQVIGMHFMNPVPVMKLVEVIRGYNTSDAVTSTVMATLSPYCWGRFCAGRVGIRLIGVVYDL